MNKCHGQLPREKKRNSASNPSLTPSPHTTLLFNVTLCGSQLSDMTIKFSWNTRKVWGQHFFLSTSVPLLNSIYWNLLKKEAIRVFSQDYICNAKYYWSLGIVLRLIKACTIFMHMYTYIYRLKINIYMHISTHMCIERLKFFLI